jgi:hypothetical protein
MRIRIRRFVCGTNTKYFGSQYVATNPRAGWQCWWYYHLASARMVYNPLQCMVEAHPGFQTAHPLWTFQRP